MKERKLISNINTKRLTFSRVGSDTGGPRLLIHNLFLWCHHSRLMWKTTPLSPPPHALWTSRPTAGNVRWCVLTRWLYNKQQVWGGSWLVMLHVFKMRRAPCTIAKVCNNIIIVIAVCRKSSKTSLICSVKPLITICNDDNVCEHTFKQRV